MKTILKTGIIALAVILLVVSPAVAQQAADREDNARAKLSAEEELAVSLLNSDRKAQGLAPLSVDIALVELARDFARDMIQRGYFSHYNPEGESPFDRMRRRRVVFRYAGENIGVNESVAAAQRVFMNSAGHRANILRANYHAVGIGVCRDDAGSVYIVQEFVGR